MEEAVLDLLKTRLMQPEAVAAFIKDYAEVSNEKGSEADALRSRLEAERKATKR